MSDEGHGVASIANMLTLTRIHNAVSSAAAMRRYSVPNFLLQASRWEFQVYVDDNAIRKSTCSRFKEVSP